MDGKEFNEVIELIVREDHRYDKHAYVFLRRALDHTLKGLQKSTPQRSNSHVTPAELLDGARRLALEQYGPLSLTVLQHWGLRGCVDFGHMVFNLVDYGVFGKTESDRLEDFAGGYDFNEAFAQPFAPARPPQDLRRLFADDEAPARATRPLGEVPAESPRVAP